jgi:hypothetical protein
VPVLKAAARVVGLAVAALGVAGVVAPSRLLDFGQTLLTVDGLYAIAAVRVAIGLLLVLGARDSRMPRTLRVIGGVIIIAGLLTPLFGLARAESMFNWLSAQGLALVRVIALFAIALGTFLVYATGPRRSSAV